MPSTLPWRLPKWLLPAAAIVVVVGFAGLLLAGRAIAGDRLPDWVRLAGVEFQGRDDASVRSAIAAAEPRLEAEPIKATAGSERVRISAKAIAYDLDPEATFRALKDAGDAGSLARVRALLGWKPATVEVGWVANHDGGRLAKEISKLAGKLDRKPRDGALSFDGEDVVERAPRTGRQLLRDEAVQEVAAALPHPGAEVRLSFKEQQPAVGADAVASAADAARALLSAPVSVSVKGEAVELSPAELATALRAAAAGDQLELKLDAAKLRAAIGPRLEQFETAPVDATFTVAGGKVKRTPSKPGNQVDMRELADAILAGERTVTAAFRAVEPELTTAKADALGIRTPISSFTTNFPAGQPRVRNIVRATQILQNRLILPGERFSLNTAIGPRTADRGFVEAPAIFKGEFVKDIGGGVSQVATTFFNTIFFAGRELNAYKAHTYYISRYPLGREATISSPYPDLVFTNDSKYGILVRTATTSTSVTITFYSTPDGRTVKAEGPQVLKKRPAGVEYVTDPEKVGDGHDGYDVVVFRVISRPGQAPKRERFFTRYDVDNTKILREES
jgi:vancomycin resistance protein YoaR